MAFASFTGNDAGKTSNAVSTPAIAPNTRLDFEVTTFKNGLSYAEMIFSTPSGGSKTGLSFELPAACLIQSATMDIEGKSYYTAASTYTDKDYSDKSDKKAYYAKNSSAPSNTNPDTLIYSSETTEFSTTMYNAIDGDDSSAAEYSSTWGGSNPYHLFKIARC